MDQTKLIEDNMKLVYFVVNKYYPTYIGDEDIIQTGMIGLCNAARNYDETLSTFSTYACRCIRNEINKEFRIRKKQIPTLSLDYDYRGGDDSESFNLTEMIIGDLDVDYVDLDRVYEYLNKNPNNKNGTKVFDLLLQGLNINEISKELGICRNRVADYSRKIKMLLER